MSFPLRAREMMKMRGETIFLIPVENSVKRYKNLSLSEQITTGILKRCSKEYYTIENIIDGYDGKFSFDTFRNNNNFGYIPFKTKKDAKDYIEVKHFKHLLTYMDLSMLSIEDVNKIKKIIREAELRESKDD